MMTLCAARSRPLTLQRETSKGRSLPFNRPGRVTTPALSGTSTGQTGSNWTALQGRTAAVLPWYANSSENTLVTTAQHTLSGTQQLGQHCWPLLSIHNDLLCTLHRLANKNNRQAILLPSTKFCLVWPAYAHSSRTQSQGMHSDWHIHVTCECVCEVTARRLSTQARWYCQGLINNLKNAHRYLQLTHPQHDKALHTFCTCIQAQKSGHSWLTKPLSYVCTKTQETRHARKWSYTWGQVHHCCHVRQLTRICTFGTDQ